MKNLKARIGGVVAVLVGIILALIFLPSRQKTDDKSVDTVSQKTASAQGPKPLAAVTLPLLPEKSSLVEEVLTICDFSQAMLGVNADSGKTMLVSVTFIAAIDSVGDKFILVSGASLMLFKGEKYAVSYRELKNHHAKIEDLRTRVAFGGLAVLQNDVEAKGVLESATLVKE